MHGAGFLLLSNNVQVTSEKDPGQSSSFATTLHPESPRHHREEGRSACPEVLREDWPALSLEAHLLGFRCPQTHQKPHVWIPAGAPLITSDSLRLNPAPNCDPGEPFVIWNRLYNLSHLILNQASLPLSTPVTLGSLSFTHCPKSSVPWVPLHGLVPLPRSPNVTCFSSRLRSQLRCHLLSGAPGRGPPPASILAPNKSTHDTVGLMVLLFVFQ